jgi:hypothetical protein
MTVALELEEARISLDTSLLPGGTEGKIKVVASDGFNTVEEISPGVFTVPEKAPAAYIESPVDLGSYALGAVALKGSGFDLEDGTMRGSELTWNSDIAGYLGSGSSVAGTSLGPGAHTITLSVVDSDGNIAESSGYHSGGFFEPEPQDPRRMLGSRRKRRPNRGSFQV